MNHSGHLVFAALLLGAFFSPLGAAERHYFNDLEAPQSMEDLLSIETALKSVLPKTRAATVCLELGKDKGSGSGVIVSEDGLILTAAHVSGGVDETFEAVMEDGTRYPVRSLGLLSNTDAAMAKIEAEGPFPFVEIENSNSTRLGDWVMSLGHSGGYDSERGIVVRLGRLVRMAQSTWQTDATLIGGDSGGPLFNLNGEVIGIHSRVGKNKVENNSVPMSEFVDNWQKMLDGEFVGKGPFATPPPGFLGVQLKEIEVGENGEDGENGEEGAEEEEGAKGVTIAEVIPDKAAAQGGLQAGDIILKVGDEEVSSIEDIQKEIKSRFAGDKVKITYLRNEEEQTIEVELGKN